MWKEKEIFWALTRQPEGRFHMQKWACLSLIYSNYFTTLLQLIWREWTLNNNLICKSKKEEGVEKKDSVIRADLVGTEKQFYITVPALVLPNVAFPAEHVDSSATYQRNLVALFKIRTRNREVSS